MTVRVELDMDATAWQDQYPDDGLLEARERVNVSVRKLVTDSRLARLGLFHVVEPPSGRRPADPPAAARYALLPREARTPLPRLDSNQ